MRKVSDVAYWRNVFSRPFNGTKTHTTGWIPLPLTFSPNATQPTFTKQPNRKSNFHWTKDRKPEPAWWLRAPIGSGIKMYQRLSKATMGSNFFIRSDYTAARPRKNWSESSFGTRGETKFRPNTDGKSGLIKMWSDSF